LADAKFKDSVARLTKERAAARASPAWFQQNHAQPALSRIAYFSMEFMLSEALPIYAGGLGNVAGDQLKASSDLGVPVVGVGLLYQQGYFRQVIDQNGGQQALYPYNEPGQLPITPVLAPDGERLRLTLDLSGQSVAVRAWSVRVGRAELYLLDSNDAANAPADRAITSELYGGNAELRLRQEVLLGIAGWRLLAALGIKPEVCHLNEGHAAFAILERARCFMEQSGQSFEVALEVTRAGNVFTTHTAVSAGFDRFTPALVEQYLGEYGRQSLGISVDALLALGRQNSTDANEPFNMAHLAIRGSGRVNGVSRLHGQVSRRLFQPLFPRWPEDEVPIGHVTNGVHMPTWDSAAADEVWTATCGKDRWLGDAARLEAGIRSASDAQLWQMRTTARRSLVNDVRLRLSRELAASGAPPSAVEEAKGLFHPEVLTLGFARRFASYKRPDLLLHDRTRLLRLLANPERPVQLVIAGKAHPEDKEGQALIQEWIQFIRQATVRAHVVFLSDYDMLVAEQVVQGVDVWINTPRRPWEACGTSGMKVLVNGGLNLSERDGWWDEAYSPQVGWAMGDGREHGADTGLDANEADTLYTLLEEKVIPEFYDRDAEGLPRAWLQRMRTSMALLTPQFSAHRTVREYTEDHYLPAAAEYQSRAAQHGAEGKRLVDWERATRGDWAAVRLGETRIVHHAGQDRFETELWPGKIATEAIRVDLCAEKTHESPRGVQQMDRLRPSAGLPGGWVYGLTVPSSRPASDYTARVVPHFPGLTGPLELNCILWQR
jgi:starch phosphorylase